jgi:hypothetical protein
VSLDITHIQSPVKCYEYFTVLFLEKVAFVVLNNRGVSPIPAQEAPCAMWSLSSVCLRGRWPCVIPPDNMSAGVTVQGRDPPGSLLLAYPCSYIVSQ